MWGWEVGLWGMLWHPLEQFHRRWNSPAPSGKNKLGLSQFTPARGIDWHPAQASPQAGLKSTEEGDGSFDAMLTSWPHPHILSPHHLPEFPNRLRTSIPLLLSAGNQEMKKLFRACELCDQEASFYCPSDSAFLCSRCDARVHQANFLVARHVRHPLCSNCKSVAETPDHHSLCSSCSPEIFSGDCDGDAMSSSSDCSACISSTEMGTTKTGYENPKSESSLTEVSGSNTPHRFPGAKRNMLWKFSGAKRNYSVPSARARTPRRVDARAEGSFVNWCKSVGVNGNLATAVVSTASNASGFCLERLAGVPLRVSLAASFWFGLRFRGDRSVSTCQNLRRVEVLSGVPAKLILAVEAKLGSELRIRRARRDDLEEGWAEC